MYQAPRVTSPESWGRAAGDGPLTWEGGPWVLARTRCHLREHNEGMWSAKPPKAWGPRQGRSRRMEVVLRPAPGAVSLPEPGDRGGGLRFYPAPAARPLPGGWGAALFPGGHVRNGARPRPAQTLALEGDDESLSRSDLLPTPGERAPGRWTS